MTNIHGRAIPKGSTVLVTGANGFLGSHIADQFLCHGYKVRATVRDSQRDSWLVNYFQGRYGKDNFELVSVPDMADERAFDQATKGVDAVVHSASVMSFDPDPNKVIPAAIAGATNALKAAYAETSVKQFVLTSSSSAAVTSYEGSPGITVTEDTWNEEAVAKAWADPPYNPERAGFVYNASKTQAEQAVWKFHAENRGVRPDLVVNAVLPNFIFGATVDQPNQVNRSSSGLAVALWKGKVSDFHHAVPRQYFVDVQDTAILHVAACILPHVRDQRIFAFAERFSWDSILDIFRKLDPSREYPAYFSGGEDPHEIEPRPKAEKLLREMGRPGWKGLKDSIAMNVHGL